mgnify:CR=1 FL=1
MVLGGSQHRVDADGESRISRSRSADSWLRRQHEALAFQPDLHPDFERTIGALTGEKPQPDRPRDYIRQWSDRVEYTQRYYPQNSNEVRQAHRILEALKAFPRRTDIFV